MEEKYKLIIQMLLNESSTNPIEILKKIMKCTFINMHGPEHHFLDGACLLTAYYNKVKNFDLLNALDTYSKRTINLPGAMCGYFGVCGSVTSVAGIFSIIDNTTPLSNDVEYKEHMKFTSNVLLKMSEIGGPRCCKRNAYISITEGIKYIEEHYHVLLDKTNIICEFSSFNKQCLKEKCPFYNN